jgi:acetolactate synthase small subunit
MLKTLTFVIYAENHPDLLARTVSLLHRLAIPIVGLLMQRPEHSARMRMTLDVLAPPDQSQRIAENLAKIVHVVLVESRKELDRPKRAVRASLLGSSR